MFNKISTYFLVILSLTIFSVLLAIGSEYKEIIHIGQKIDDTDKVIITNNYYDSIISGIKTPGKKCKFFQNKLVCVD